MTEVSDEMLFSPEAQEAYWSAMSPDTRAFLQILEERESWTQKFDDNPELFIRLANVLLEVGVLPVDDKTQQILENLIPLLTSMPLMMGVFAIDWLNQQAPDSPVGWGTFCYLEALNIANNKPDHEQYKMAVAMVARIETVMKVRGVFGLNSNWTLKSA
ncbi:hypothetical protein ACYPKM_02890 [Pseudomonas aeruginosa]